MHTAARRSLLSVAITAVFITINHLYSLGPTALVLGAVLLLAPTALLLWFRSTKSEVAFAGYLLMNLWIVAGFGLAKGFWGGLLRLFAGTGLATVATSFPKPVVGSYGFEASGLLMFVGSLFVAYTAYELIQAKRAVQVVPARVVWTMAAVLAALAAVFVWTDQDRWSAPIDGIVRIGVIVPRSGPYALLGGSFLKAVEMAKEDLGQTRYQYQLVQVDVGTDPRAARAAIQRAIREDRLDGIVGGISLFGQVTKPLASAARIPHTCVCTVTSIGDGAYNFTNIPTPEAEATLWVREAQRRGITRVALLSQDYPSIHNHVRALKIELARAGLPISYEQEFSDTVTGFRSLISAAQASRPDVYYVEALSPQLDVLARQLTSAKIHNIASVVAPSLSQHPELFEGAWYTDSDLRDFEFKTRFERKYPGMQFATHMMPYAYDDFNLIVQAFERGQNPAVYLRNITRYEGTAGPITRAPGSGNFQSAPAVWTIRKGKPALYN